MKQLKNTINTLRPEEYIAHTTKTQHTKNKTHTKSTSHIQHLQNKHLILVTVLQLLIILYQRKQNKRRLWNKYKIKKIRVNGIDMYKAVKE